MSDIQTETETEQEVASSQKSSARGIRIALLLVLLMTFGVLGLFMAYSHLPSAGPGDSGATNDLVTPTAVVSNLQGSLNVGRSLYYKGANIKVTQVVQATSFSDDTKLKGPHIIRVYVASTIAGQAPVGVDFPKLTHLVLPDGSSITPSLVTIVPFMLPNEVSSGYFDFPATTKLDLSSLGLHIGNSSTLFFK